MYHPVKPCAVCGKVYCVRNGFFKPEVLKEDANLYFNVCISCAKSHSTSNIRKILRQKKEN
jgi:hypothetical protein